MKSTNRAETSTFNSAINMMRSVADTVGKSYSETTASSRNSGTAREQSEGESHTVGGSDVHTTSESETVSKGRKKEWGRAETHGRTRTLTRSEQKSLAEAFSILVQVSQNLSWALQKTASKTATLGGSIQETVTEGEALARAESLTATDSATERKVFFTLEGERELMINRLQKLPRRHCIVTKEALGAMEIRTLDVPEWYYFYQGERLPEEIIERQRDRYGLPESEKALELSPQLIRFPKQEQEEEPEKEDWFPDW